MNVFLGKSNLVKSRHHTAFFLIWKVHKMWGTLKVKKKNLTEYSDNTYNIFNDNIYIVRWAKEADMEV